jgi:hypothetical protein
MEAMIEMLAGHLEEGDLQELTLALRRSNGLVDQWMDSLVEVDEAKYRLIRKVADRVSPDALEDLRTLVKRS